MSDQTKNIVILLDGTGNRPRIGKSTNVVEVAEAVDTSACSQLVYYLPGVGTRGSDRAYTRVGAAASRGWGQLTGYGVRKNVGLAYDFVMQNYERGDSIHIFGFSRGAFTACALTGLLHHQGLLRPEHSNLVRGALDRCWWAKNFKATDADWQEPATFANRFGRSDFQPRTIPGQRPHDIHLYLWDNVKAMGFLRRDVSIPYSKSLRAANSVSHALAIDERRRPFKPKPISHPEAEQVWFPGVHSDVGGFYREEKSAESHSQEPEPCLGDLSLGWMVAQAQANGLRFRNAAIDDLRARSARGAAGTIHHHHRWWFPFTALNRRTVPPDVRVHPSAASRFPGNPVVEPTQLGVNVVQVADITR